MRGVGGEQRTRSILFGLLLLFFFSPLNKHVKTRILTWIDIRLIFLALKTWFKRPEYSKLSSFNKAGVNMNLIDILGSLKRD